LLSVAVAAVAARLILAVVDATQAAVAAQEDLLTKIALLSPPAIAIP
jgi:hypothetical protein